MFDSIKFFSVFVPLLFALAKAASGIFKKDVHEKTSCYVQSIFWLMMPLLYILIRIFGALT